MNSMNTLPVRGGKVDPLLFGAKEDPKTKRNWKRIGGSAGLLLAALGGSYYTDNTVDAGRNWTEARVQQIEEGSTGDTFTSKTLDKVAEVETGIRNVKFVTGTQNAYVTLIELQLLLLGFTALKNVKKKTINPKDIYKELHDRGITGEGLKIGVVDSGFKKRKLFNKTNVELYQPDDLDTPAKFKDKIGHGTAVTEQIRKGMPDAEFVVVSYATKQDEKEVSKNISKLLDQSQHDPSKLDINQIRAVYKPLIENIANGVKKCIDEGSSVVNVSLSVEQAVKINLMVQMAMQALTIPVYAASEKYTGKGGDKKEAKLKLIEHLYSISRADNTKDKVNDELKAIYQPWIDTLDYALEKNVPVVLASGNSGGHNNKSEDNIGHMNLLALTDHPALIVVGSTNEAGQISNFTSESNNQVLPHIAANGSGEMETEIRLPDRSLWKKLLFPFGGIKAREKYNKAFRGTSSAAPDTTLLVGAMQLARGEKPELSITELKEILADVAEAPYLGKFQKILITKEIEGRLKNAKFKSAIASDLRKKVDDVQKGAADKIDVNPDEISEMIGNIFGTSKTNQKQFEAELAKEIERRVGYGTIVGKRLEAVDRAENFEKPTVEAVKTPE